MGHISLEEGVKYERTPFGKAMLKHFLFDPGYKNLNHGTNSRMVLNMFWVLLF